MLNFGTVKHALVFLIPLLALGCNPPSDLGNVCELRIDGGLWTSAVSPTDDFFYQGTTQCENLVCLRPAGSPLDAGYGICSNTCTPQNASDPNSLSDDCGGRASGLVCRQLSLSPEFIQGILALDGGQQLLDEVLGGNTVSTYCTTPTN
jgi:hypothetical protein